MVVGCADHHVTNENGIANWVHYAVANAPYVIPCCADHHVKHKRNTPERAGQNRYLVGPRSQDSAEEWASS